MSAPAVPDDVAETSIADATIAVLLGDPVRIVDDLASGGGAVTVVTAGPRCRWSADAVAMAMPTWRAHGPKAVPAGVSTVHRVPDLGLVVDADLATASVDLLRLVGADPVALHLGAWVEPSATVTLSAIARAWCARTMTVEHLSQARMPTPHGVFTAHVLRDAVGDQHVMLTMGEDPSDGPTEVIAECVVGMAMGGRSCTCRAMLDEALRHVARGGTGSVLLVRAGLAELAAPAGCAEWSSCDPAVDLRRRAVVDAALASVKEQVGGRDAATSPYRAACDA